MTCRSSSFITDRLVVGEWRTLSFSNKDIVNAVAAILTPRVTQSLPEEWRGKYSHSRAAKWLEDIDQEAATLLVLDRITRNPIGLMVLFESVEERSGHIVRIGYMLAESAWGNGYATELLQGFVNWCKKTEIASVIGGVEKNNVTSQRVMEKNGFRVLANPQIHSEILYELRLQ